MDFTFNSQVSLLERVPKLLIAEMARSAPHMLVGWRLLMYRSRGEPCYRVVSRRRRGERRSPGRQSG